MIPKAAPCAVRASSCRCRRKTPHERERAGREQCSRHGHRRRDHRPHLPRSFRCGQICPCLRLHGGGPSRGRFRSAYFRRSGLRLPARPSCPCRRPEAITGLIELRHAGIVKVESLPHALLHYAILPVEDGERLPPERETATLAAEITLPALRVPTGARMPFAFIKALIATDVAHSPNMRHRSLRLNFRFSSPRWRPTDGRGLNVRVSGRLFAQARGQ